MLYEIWLQIAAQRRHETALRDFARGQCWTFQELDAAAEAWPLPAGGMVFPRGDAPGFVLEVLAAWRAGRVVCPLDPGQSAPQVPEPLAGCAHLKSTSATTGAPRLAAFTAAQLAADARNIVAAMGLRPDWPTLGVISPAHSYGFSNLVLPLLLHGIPLILARSPLPEVVLQAAKDEPNLTLPAVPALWRAWHEAGAVPPSVRLAISAGAPLPVALERAVFADHGLKIHNFYGSTECGGIAYDASERPRADETRVGAPMPNVTLSVNAENCLAVNGDAVAETYWPEPAETLGDGLFQTEDLAELRQDGVYLRGRLSDQINVAGRKVSPEVVEQALLQHPSVSGCLVFGAPAGEGGRGETIVACVMTAVPVENAVLREHLASRLPAWQLPREWWFVESLEASHRGKLSRAEWRRRFLDRPLRRAPS